MRLKAPSSDRPPPEQLLEMPCGSEQCFKALSKHRFNTLITQGVTGQQCCSIRFTCFDGDGAGAAGRTHWCGCGSSGYLDQAGYFERKSNSYVKQFQTIEADVVG